MMEEILQRRFVFMFFLIRENFVSICSLQNRREKFQEILLTAITTSKDG